jgi:hypothetical protein
LVLVIINWIRFGDSVKKLDSDYQVVGKLIAKVNVGSRKYNSENLKLSSKTNDKL